MEYINRTALLLAANTGNGHIDGMNAVYSHLVKTNMRIKQFPFFYEEIVPSNQQLSDFYNLLQQTSFELCRQYTHLALLESPKKVMENYEKFWKKPLAEFFVNNPANIVISFAPIINKYVSIYLKESNTSVKFYVVVLDPFDPIYPGFDSYPSNWTTP